MEYKLVIDQQLIDEYNALYLKTHPRAKKVAISAPIPVSLNQFLLMRRPQQNYIKQTWKDFTGFMCRKFGYDGLKLEKFEVELSVFKKNAHKYDLDNYAAVCGKLIFDGLTECGMIVDDNVTNLVKLTVTGGYDKENPRTVLVLRTIDD